MSDTLDQTGCIRHRETARYFTYYEDFQELSQKSPDKVAAFLRVLEVKTNKKLITYETLMEEAILNGKDLPDLNLWLEVSYNDFVYYSLKTMGRSSFQIADKETEGMMLVKSRVRQRRLRPDDPDSPQVQYKEYLMVLENVQAMIDNKELPITDKDFEEYGSVPPVLKNIPLLQKTWDMLQKTREDMFSKTRPRVVKNRLKSNTISNPSNLSDNSGSVTSENIANDNTTDSSLFTEIPSSGNQPGKTTRTPATQQPIPFEEMPWGAEKALELTEKLVETKYRNRDKELEKCAELLRTYKPNEEMYTKVVSKILTWYKNKNKLLHPSDLTKKKKDTNTVWFEVLLEEIEYQEKLANKPAKQKNTSGPSQSFYVADLMKEKAQRDIQRLDPDYVEDPNEEDRLTEAQLESYLRAIQ